jgi:hypothetical protein
MIAALLALVGCPGPSDSDSDSEGADTCDDALPTEGEWSVAATAIEGGALLAAYSRGAELVMVGGELGVGPGLIVRTDGDGLCAERAVTERPLWWVHGEGDVYTAVGEGGLVLRDDGGVRTREDVPTSANLFGVQHRGDEVIAVGGVVAEGRGEVWVRRDGTWSPIATDLPHVAFKVWDDVIVGDGGAWILGDDDSLTPIDTAGVRLLTVRSRDGEYWAVGGRIGPTVLTGDGVSFTAADTTGLLQPLNGVFPDPNGDVWVAGNFGTMARDDGTAWVQPSPPPTADPLHAVWPHCGEVWFVGGTLFATEGHTATLARFGPNDEVLRVRDCE